MAQSPQPNLAGTAVAVASGLAIAALLIFERRRPLRRPTRAVLPRTVRNAVMGAMCTAVVAAVETPIVQGIAKRNAGRTRGLAGFAPPALRPLVAFLAMDYGFYLWHVATHRVPLLWRLHRVHHVDPDLDLSNAVRFHMIDMFVSLPWRIVQVRGSGVGPRTLEAWQRFFTLSILFHHSNLALPAGWDRRLARVLTTPEMHGIHHSADMAHQASNWSSGLSLWDRLHGTFRQDLAPDRVTIGVDDPLATRDVRIENALRSPFRKPRA